MAHRTLEGAFLLSTAVADFMAANRWLPSTTANTRPLTSSSLKWTSGPCVVICSPKRGTCSTGTDDDEDDSEEDEEEEEEDEHEEDVLSYHMYT